MIREVVKCKESVIPAYAGHAWWYAVTGRPVPGRKNHARDTVALGS